MRIVFIGAGEVAAETAKALGKKGHELLFIEVNKDRIEVLSDELDCSFLHGDGADPRVLRETSPEKTDFLFCLTDHDQANIIASLVGRSLGFKRVITRISDPQLEELCNELGLDDTIIPSRTIGRHLADMVIGGGKTIELATIIKDEARFFSFVASDKEAVAAEDLQLPDSARIICYYREGKFLLPDNSTKFSKGDEIIILTHSKNLPELQKRWSPKDALNGKGERVKDKKK